MTVSRDISVSKHLRRKDLFVTKYIARNIFLTLIKIALSYVITLYSANVKKEFIYNLML